MPFEIKENTFYTLKELSDQLKITIFTLRNWIKAGQLKASKVGREYMISSKSMKVFLEKGTGRSTNKK